MRRRPSEGGASCPVRPHLGLSAITSTLPSAETSALPRFRNPRAIRVWPWFGERCRGNPEVGLGRAKRLLLLTDDPERGQRGRTFRRLANDAGLRILRAMKYARNPGSIHPPLAGYSHHIELDQSERLLVISGQVGMAQDGRVPDDPGEQFDLALGNVLRNVEAAGMSAQDIVKLTFYLTEPIDQARRAAILGQQLGDHAPCTTLLFVAGLAVPGLKVEIDAWASTADSAARD